MIGEMQIMITLEDWGPISAVPDNTPVCIMKILKLVYLFYKAV